MFHTHRKALCGALATALALGATAAPRALAQPTDLGVFDTRHVPASARVEPDMRSADQVTPHAITRPRAGVEAPTSGLDWGSAGIGGGAAAGAFAIGLAGIAGRRRRIAVGGRQ